MRFGIASVSIVPSFRMPMHGYGARHDTFDDVHDPLTFTALILEEGRRRALIGAADLCTFPNDGSVPGLRAKLARIAKCPADSVMLNASHTHGGPQTPGNSLYFKTNIENKELVFRYRDFLGRQILKAARQAAARMTEGALWIGEGRTRLPMNRRIERNGVVVNAPNPAGRVDDRMHLFVLRNATGEMAAVGMRVSCHPVATGDQHRLTADYPGAWRAAFAEAFGPKVTPFFLQGAGADARPHHVAEGDHWRILKHAELPILGHELLEDSLAVLTSGRLKEVRNLTLKGTIKTVQAPCENPYRKPEDLEPLLKSDYIFHVRYAEEWKRLHEAGEKMPDHADFQVQTLWLNSGLCLIGLEGEPLEGLGRFVEKSVAPRQGLVIGYVNGCVAYLPDRAEMKRGGYEASSYIYEPWSGPMKPGLENFMADAVAKR